MSGETQQRLYDPNGLSGSLTLYHCRLTTANGQTLYTCPQTFDDVPRSADNTDAANAPEQVINIYQVGPHVRILQIKKGDYIFTQKIITHE